MTGKPAPIIEARYSVGESERIATLLRAGNRGVRDFARALEIPAVQQRLGDAVDDHALDRLLV